MGSNKAGRSHCLEFLIDLFTDKRAACAALGGYLSSSYTVLECEIECCTGDNCNDGGNK